MFEGKFEYQNGCEQTTVATVLGGSKDTGYYTETLLDGESSCSLITKRLEENDSKEEEEDDQCSVGKPNRFIGGAFNAKAAIAYNKRTGDCELMYMDLSTDPCDVYPQSLGVKAVINVRNKHAIIPSLVTTTTTETNIEVPQIESRDMMFLYFTNDYGGSFYNGHSPRLAIRTTSSVMGDVDDNDEGDERFNERYYQMIVNQIKKDANNDDGRRRRSLQWGISSTSSSSTCADCNSKANSGIAMVLSPAFSTVANDPAEVIKKECGMNPSKFQFCTDAKCWTRGHKCSWWNRMVCCPFNGPCCQGWYNKICYGCQYYRDSSWSF